MIQAIVPPNSQFNFAFQQNGTESKQSSTEQNSVELSSRAVCRVLYGILYVIARTSQTAAVYIIHIRDKCGWI